MIDLHLNMCASTCVCACVCVRVRAGVCYSVIGYHVFVNLHNKYQTSAPKSLLIGDIMIV